MQFPFSEQIVSLSFFAGELNQERDNRNLQDTSENQKLTHDDVLTLKKEGVSGQVRTLN